MSWRDVGMHASHARPLRVTVTAFSVSTLSTVTKPIPSAIPTLDRTYLRQVSHTFVRSPYCASRGIPFFTKGERELPHELEGMLDY
ncbi:hypothetical protein B296_00016777 [Ensete ventricosum]|uniref:Uncharacterized protein n=1 Tax=Ensete ventricosum TaxID=4639 RepID=A0A427AE17_ENSVE|nr:hypothetical protein B296_00016777 [Ensete ventricosum]